MTICTYCKCIKHIFLFCNLQYFCAENMVFFHNLKSPYWNLSWFQQLSCFQWFQSLISFKRKGQFFNNRGSNLQQSYFLQLSPSCYKWNTVLGLCLVKGIPILWMQYAWSLQFQQFIPKVQSSLLIKPSFSCQVGTWKATEKEGMHFCLELIF